MAPLLHRAAINSIQGRSAIQTVLQEYAKDINTV